MNCIPKAPGSSVTKNSIHLSEPEAEQQKPSLVSSGLCQILSGVPVKSTLYVGVDKSQGCANALFAGKKNVSLYVGYYSMNLSKNVQR